VEKEVLVATPTFNVGDEVPADIIG
jgi:hypothetical protein